MICPACRKETGQSLDGCPHCGQPLGPYPARADVAHPDVVHLSSDEGTRLHQPVTPEAAASVLLASDEATRVFRPAQEDPDEQAGDPDEQATVLHRPAPGDTEAATAPFQAPSRGTFRLSQSPAPPDTPPPSLRPSGQPSGPVPSRLVQPTLESGTFGRYRIVRLLGAGGMGEVYEAYDEELGERVALKIIRADFAQSADADARFRRELSVARQVTHRNVVRIHDLGIADGRKYISMSFVDGEDLSTVMARGRVPGDQAIPIAEQLCAGLSAAHQAGIVHRDLKPGNVMVDRAGRVFLMDFGLARSVEETQYTQAGVVFGTLDYMSPEQATGQTVDHRSDIYALGLILYELMAGERPFKGDSSMTRLTSRLAAPVPNPRVAHPALEPYLANIIMRCLERDPAQRYQSVDEVLADLTARRGSSRRWRRLAAGVASRPAWKRAAAAVAVVVAVAVGALLFVGRDRPDAGPSAAGPVGAPQVSLAIVPFRNASGDPSLDWLGASLGEMLGADVGQSSAVRTVSSSRLQQILQDLAVPADAAIDPATLRRLAEFSNADTLVWGQYIRAGEQIRIDATVQNLKESRSLPLASEVTTEKDVLAAVDRLARSIRAAVTTSPDVLRELGASAFRPSSSSIPAVRAYNEGLQLARRGNHQNAVTRFAESVAADPAFALAHSQLALSYASLGQDDRAEASSRRAVQLGANLQAREKYLIQANHARIINDNEQAVQAYQELARVSPGDPDVQFALASLREGMGALDEARKGYENVLVRDPKQVEALLSIGRVHIKQQDPQASLDFLNRALTLSIETGDTEEKGRVLHTIGVAYKRLNKPEDALRYYREAMEIRRGIGQKNGIAATLSELADVQKTLGRPAEALASYREALGLQREIGDRRGAGVTSLNLGVFLMDSGSYDEALTLFREALQVNRDAGDEGGQARSLNNIGAVYFWTGTVRGRPDLLPAGARAAREVERPVRYRRDRPQPRGGLGAHRAVRRGGLALPAGARAVPGRGRHAECRDRVGGHRDRVRGAGPLRGGAEGEGRSAQERARGRGRRLLGRQGARGIRTGADARRACGGGRPTPRRGRGDRTRARQPGGARAGPDLPGRPPVLLRRHASCRPAVSRGDEGDGRPVGSAPAPGGEAWRGACRRRGRKRGRGGRDVEGGRRAGGRAGTEGPVGGGIAVPRAGAAGETGVGGGAAAARGHPLTRRAARDGGAPGARALPAGAGPRGGGRAGRRAGPHGPGAPARRRDDQGGAERGAGHPQRPRPIRSR